MHNIDIIKGEFSTRQSLHLAQGIKAGFPSPAEDYAHESLDFNRDLIRSVEPSDGDIVVAFINEEFTIKYLDLAHRDEGYIELKPANPKYHPIKISTDDEFEVWGVVLWTIKNWRRY